MLSTGPGSSGSTGFLALGSVPEKYLEEARLLLDVDQAEESDIVTCPECDSELELDETEWEQGWFICPVCNEQISLDDLFS